MHKHILVVSQYFYPEQFRINDICTEWIKRGYKVTVLTGIPNYPEGKYYKGYGLFSKRRDKYNGIEIIRIPLVPRGRNKLTLVANYSSFVVSGFFWYLFTRIKADYVFIFEVSPMTQALPGLWYAKRKKIPCYLYVQDLWPDNVEVSAGITNKTIINLVGDMTNKIYKKSTKIFVTSPSFAVTIENRNVPKEKVVFWPQYAEDFNKPLCNVSIKEIPNDNIFNIIFAGNIGTAQGLDVLIEAADLLSKDIIEDKVRFNIVGDGRHKESLVQQVKEKKLTKMFNFISKQPSSRIPEFLAVCDAAFISLAKNPIFEMTIPAKLQTYMACGIPLIASADGEVERIIHEADAGICGPSGDAAVLADNILKTMKCSNRQLQKYGLNARGYSENNFDKSKLLNIMDTYFE